MTKSTRSPWACVRRRPRWRRRRSMSLVTTPAIVLQTYRYSETSKVVRLATRDLGVQSAIAKGALRPLVSVLGFAPSLASCARDGTTITSQSDAPVAFSVADGGALCPRCAPTEAASRLPPQAFRDLVALNDVRATLPLLDSLHAAAHRRLVARFVRYHLAETSPLSALDFWEHHAWMTH